MSKTKTKYPNIYFDDKRNKYEYRKMINGSLLFGRADTSEEALKLLIDAESRNTNDKSKKKKVLPDLNSICDSYLKYRKNNIKTTYMKKLKNTFNLYIKNHFRIVPVNELNDNDFKMYYKFLFQTQLSVKTKNTYLNLLKDLFKYVFLMYDYDCIYVKRLQIFKDYSINTDEINEVRVLSFDDIKKLYNVIDNSYDQFLLLTLFLLGGRAGEILALNTTSFDLEKNIIKIQYAATWKSEKKGFELVRTKTPTSKRIYPLPELYKIKYIEHLRKYNIPKTYKYIFFSRNNHKQPMCSSSLNRKVSAWSKILGFRIYPHLFRHTTASLLNSSGISVDVIQHLLGHSSEEITKSVYIHDTEEKKEAMNVLINGFIDEINKKI